MKGEGLRKDTIMLCLYFRFGFTEVCVLEEEPPPKNKNIKILR